MRQTKITSSIAAWAIPTAFIVGVWAEHQRSALFEKEEPNTQNEAPVAKKNSAQVDVARLPKAQAGQTLEAYRIDLTHNKLIAGDRSLATISDGHFDSEQVQNHLLLPLYDLLNDKYKENVGKSKSIDSVIYVAADDSTRYGTLVDTLYTAGRAGFERYGLIVQSEGTQPHVLELAPPVFSRPAADLWVELREEEIRLAVGPETGERQIFSSIDCTISWDSAFEELEVQLVHFFEEHPGAVRSSFVTHDDTKLRKVVAVLDKLKIAGFHRFEIVEGWSVRPTSSLGVTENQNRPRVIQLWPTVVGAEENVIRRIVRAHINELAVCYKRTLAEKPEARGTVEIDFKVSAQGKVVSAQAVEPSGNRVRFEDFKFERCVLGAFKRWRFPKYEGGFEVTYPIRFQLSLEEAKG